MEDKLKQQETKQVNDLSDIVLEKESGDNTAKMKKLLLYAASLILLFLVALVAMKLFNNTPKGADTNLAEIGSDIQKPVDESVDQISQKLEDTNKLFQQEPIIDESAETDLKFEEMVRKLKAQDAAESQEPAESVEKVAKPAAPVQETFTQKAEKITKAAAQKREEVAQDIKKAAHDTERHVQKRVSKAKESAKKVIAPKIVEAPKKPKIVARPAQETVLSGRMESTARTPKLATLSGYFIQVGATANTFPDRRYLQKIKNAGYDYIVHSTIVHGRKVKKILIGPFASRAEAKSKLPYIQAKINQGAYVYRIK